MAADNQYQRVYLIDNGGINTVLPDEHIAENELADARNVVPEAMGVGTLKKRRGISKYNAVALSNRTFIGSIYSGVKGPYYTDQSASDWDIRSGATGSSVKSGTASVAFPSWSSLEGYDLVVDGTNALKTSNGSTFTALANIPSGAKWLAVYNNILFCAGHDGYTLRGADVGTVETWTATNEFKFTNNSADLTTGLLNAGKVLILFMNSQFHHIQGYSWLSMTISYSNRSVGCLSHRSAVLSPYGAFWWSDRGLTWAKDLQDTMDFVTARKLDSSFLVHPGNAGSIHGVWDAVSHAVHMYIPYGGGTTCNMRIDYYPEKDAIYLQDGAAAAMACSAYVLMPA
jgi:hypothetical protein